MSSGGLKPVRLPCLAHSAGPAGEESALAPVSGSALDGIRQWKTAASGSRRRDLVGEAGEPGYPAGSPERGGDTEVRIESGR